MSDNVVNNISNYTYGSPRYNATRAYTVDKIPNDYGHHDGLNGTYDKWFPLYRITNTTEPRLEIITAEGNTSELKGSLALKPIQSRYTSKNYGAIKGNSEQPLNSNLEKQTVFYSNWAGVRLNPAWTTIQNTIDSSSPGVVRYIPSFLVRILANEAVIKGVHAIALGETQTWSNVEFPSGMIVEYKSNIWKCVRQTREYPPSTAYSNTYWQICPSEINVFRADLFSLSESGESMYMLEVTDSKRKFNPLDAGSDLVCWNVAYHHST